MILKAREQSTKMENYIDKLFEQKKKHPETAREPLKQLTQEQIDKLQLLGPQITAETYLEKLQHIYRKNPSNSHEIENLCYLGLGKLLVKQRVDKHKQNEITRVNLYIRDFNLPTAEKIIKQKEIKYPNHVYILAQKRGICFAPDKFPEKLKDHIEKIKFFQIIREINLKIQQAMCSHRNKQKQSDYLHYILFGLVLLVGLMTICYQYLHFDVFAIICGLVIGFTLLMILIYAIHIFKIKKVCVSIIDSITQQLNTYMNFLTIEVSPTLQWQIGIDFFWIQIRILDEKFEDHISEKVKDDNLNSFSSSQSSD